MLIPYVLSWRDIIEILFFSSLFYYATLWLARDKQKNLVLIFYGFCIISASAYLLELQTISIFLFMYGPIGIMFFALIHQRTLQKNLVGLFRIKPASQIKRAWSDVLMRTVLTAMNNKKTIYCIIERADALDELLSSPLTLNTPIEQNGLLTLIQSDVYNQNSMIWINHAGTIRAINSSFHQSIRMQWFMNESHQAHTWKYDALMFTSNTDALMLYANPKTRSFTIVAQGKALDNLDGPQAHTIIKQYFNAAPLKKQKGEHEYGFVSSSEKNSVNQQRL